MKTQPSNKILPIGLLCGLMLIASNEAKAELVGGTLTGTISSGTDNANAFGGGSLAGKTVTFQFSYDTGTISNYTSDNVGFSSGNLSGVTETVTIAGQSFSVTGGGSIQATSWNESGYNKLTLANSQSANGVSLFLDACYEAAFAYDVRTAAPMQDNLTRGIPNLQVVTIKVQDATGTDTIQLPNPTPLGSVTVTASATPEPSTIATLLAAMGVICGLAHGRRKK